MASDVLVNRRAERALKEKEKRIVKPAVAERLLL